MADDLVLGGGGNDAYQSTARAPAPYRPPDPNDPFGGQYTPYGQYGRPMQWWEQINPVNATFTGTVPLNTYQAPQRDYLADVGTAYGQQQNARTQQQQLADLLRDRVMGRGPSVAEQMLRQQTNRLQQQQAGMIASQRGMNPALQRRLILQQAANAQQQMAGQGSLLRAQEMLANQNALSQQLSGMRGQDLGAYGTGGELSQAQNVLNQKTAAENQQAASDWQDRKLRADQFNANQNKEIIGNALNMLGGLFNFGGGGGAAGGAGGAGAMGGMNSAMGGAASSGSGGLASAAGGMLLPAVAMAGGGMVPGYNCGGYAARLMGGGGVVPGSAKVEGDSPKNDTVPAWLSPGEAVIPRSIMESPTAPEEAAGFVAALLKQRYAGHAKSPAMRLMGAGSK